MAMNASVGIQTHSPAYQACQILHLAFVVAPLIAGGDKFFHFYDIALRDLGLAFGALARARLATDFDIHS